MAIPYIEALSALFAVLAFCLYVIYLAVEAIAGREGAKKTLVPALLVAVAGIVFYAAAIEPQALHVSRTSIDISKMDTPLKIVFISDIHAGTVSEDFFGSAVEAANSEKPDVILLGGDYNTLGGSDAAGLRALKNISAKYGVYAVLGNHDYLRLDARDCSNPQGDEQAEKISSQLEGMGIRVLRNERVELPDGVTLAGVDDYWACKSDYGKAVKGANLSGPILLLTHNQEAIPQSGYGKLSLILTGHTHCGQVRLPFVGSIPRLLGFRGDYDAGLYQLGRDSYMYTTCGIGGGPPRFLAVPEVAVVELY